MAIDFDLCDPDKRAWLESQGYRNPIPGVITHATPVKPRKNKYNAQRTEYNGVMYDSKAEAGQAAILDMDGNVQWWLRQVTIPLGPDFKTRVDFLVAKSIVCQNSNVAIYVYAVEVKGFETKEFRKVRELWEKYGPFDLKIVKSDSSEVILGKS